MEAPSLINLPIEVHDLIFKELHFCDKLSLAQSHKNLQEAFNLNIKNKFEHIDPRILPVRYWSTIIPLSGQKILKVHELFETNDNVPIKLIDRHCFNLESIQLNVNHRNIKDVASLLKNRKTLRSVHLYFYGECRFTEKIMRALKRLPKLNNLLLYGLEENQVHHVQDLERLEFLSLSIKRKYESTNIFEICSRLKLLKTLYISNFNITLNQTDPQDLVFPNLETLDICYCNISTELPHFKKLKKITFWRNSYFVRKQSLYHWISRHANTIEALEMRCAVDAEFREIDFLEVLKECKKLSKFRLHNRITNLFLAPLIHVLLKNGRSVENCFYL
ncbi:hypothetical protein KR074_009524, partial [Drosophila pseudoananassae]